MSIQNLLQRFSALLPFSKLGALALRKFDGSLLSVPFTRAGVSFVFRGGQFLNLAENEPEWDDPFDSERPRLWFRPETENLIRDSEPDSSPALGTSTNLQFDANGWDIGLAGKIMFGDNSVARTYFNTPETSAQTRYGISFLMKTASGNYPSFGLGPTKIARVVLGGVAVESNYIISEPIPGIFFVSVSAFCLNASTDNGIVKGVDNSSESFEVSAISLVSGYAPTYLSHYIRTYGAPETRSATSLPPLTPIASGLLDVAEGTIVLGAYFTRSHTEAVDTLLELGTDDGLKVESGYNLTFITVYRNGSPVVRKSITQGDILFVFSWDVSGWKLFNNDNPTPIAEGSDVLNVQDRLAFFSGVIPFGLEVLAAQGKSLSDSEGAELWSRLSQDIESPLGEVVPTTVTEIPVDSPYVGLDVNDPQLILINDPITKWLVRDGVWDSSGWWVSSAKWVSSPSPTPTTPDLLSSPTLSGDTDLGDTLTVNPGSWSGADTIETQILRDGSPVSGATATTYVIVAADQGTTLVARVTATNTEGSTVVNSNALVIPEAPPPPPPPSGLPELDTEVTITGVAEVGNVLTLNPGQWTDADSFGYRWYRDGVVIVGEDALTYELTAIDDESVVYGEVVATNANGSTTVQSNNLLISDDWLFRDGTLDITGIFRNDGYLPTN